MRITQTGDIEYHFGPNAREDIDQLKERKKRQMKDTPQKGRKECSHPHHVRQNDMNVYFVCLLGFYVTAAIFQLYRDNQF